MGPALAHSGLLRKLILFTDGHVPCDVMLRLNTGGRGSCGSRAPCRRARGPALHRRPRGRLGVPDCVWHGLGAALGRERLPGRSPPSGTKVNRWDRDGHRPDSPATGGDLLSPVGWSPTVASAGDSAIHGPHDPNYWADHGQDDADGPQTRNAHEETDDEQDDAEGDHDVRPNSGVPRCIDVTCRQPSALASSEPSRDARPVSAIPTARQSAGRATRRRRRPSRRRVAAPFSRAASLPPWVFVLPQFTPDVPCLRPRLAPVPPAPRLSHPAHAVHRRHGHGPSQWPR